MVPPSHVLMPAGGVVKNWKRRFFVLSLSGLLYYYKDDKVFCRLHRHRPNAPAAFFLFFFFVCV